MMNLKLLAKKLVSHSSEIESSIASAPGDELLAALTQFSGLEAITRDSLPLPPEAAPPKPAAAAPAPDFRYQSTKTSYQPALNDNQGLVDALLKYHQTRRGKPAPGPRSGVVPAAFAPARAPRVEPAIRDEPAFQRKKAAQVTAPITGPVLRSRPPGK
jgi:hypothetical protein